MRCKRQTARLPWNFQRAKRRDFISQTTYKRRREKHVKSLLPIVSIGVNGRALFYEWRRASLVIHYIARDISELTIFLPFYIASPVKHWSFTHFARVIHVRSDLICIEIAFREFLIRSAAYRMQLRIVYEDAIKSFPEIHTIPYSSSIIFINNDKLLKIYSNIGRLNLSRYRWIEITNAV